MLLHLWGRSLLLLLFDSTLIATTSEVKDPRASCSARPRRAPRAPRPSAAGAAPRAPLRARPSSPPGRPPAPFSGRSPLRPVPRARRRPWRGPWRARRRRAGPRGRGGRRRRRRRRWELRRGQRGQPSRRTRGWACTESKGRRRSHGPWRARPRRAGRGRRRRRRPVCFFPVEVERKGKKEVERKQEERHRADGAPDATNDNGHPSVAEFGSLPSFVSLKSRTIEESV